MDAGAELIERMRLLCGTAHVLTDPVALSTYRSDGIRREGPLPLAVALPANGAEVAGVVTACAATGVRWVVRGAGTSRSGHALPLPGGLLIVLTRMRRIKSIDLDDEEVTAEAGVPMEALTRALGPGHHRLPLNYPGTVGGAAAQGVLARDLIGLELVEGSGALVSCDGVRYSVPANLARAEITMQRRPDGLSFLVDGAVVARHSYAKPGVRLVQSKEHLPPKPQPRHERFAQLGDRVAESFGELGRSYAVQIERRAPHAPLALLREVLQGEAEFGRPIVAAVIESLLHFGVFKRGTLPRLCYRFGTIPKTTDAPTESIPKIDVEKRSLSIYDEMATA